MFETLTRFAHLFFGSQWELTSLGVSVASWFVTSSALLVLLIGFVTTSTWHPAIRWTAVPLVLLVIYAGYRGEARLIQDVCGIQSSAGLAVGGGP